MISMVITVIVIMAIEVIMVIEAIEVIEAGMATTVIMSTGAMATRSQFTRRHRCIMNLSNLPASVSFSRWIFGASAVRINLEDRLATAGL